MKTLSLVIPGYSKHGYSEHAYSEFMLTSTNYSIRLIFK